MTIVALTRPSETSSYQLALSKLVMSVPGTSVALLPKPPATIRRPCAAAGVICVEHRAVAALERRVDGIGGADSVAHCAHDAPAAERIVCGVRVADREPGRLRPRLDQHAARPDDPQPRALAKPGPPAIAIGQ